MRDPATLTTVAPLPRTRRRWASRWAAGLAGALALGVVVNLTDPTEPRLDGRRDSAWVAQALGSSRSAAGQRSEATELSALRERLGDERLARALIKFLRAQGPAEQERIEQFVYEFGPHLPTWLSRQLVALAGHFEARDPNGRWQRWLARVAAVDALDSLGVAAAPATRVLGEFFWRSGSPYAAERTCTLNLLRRIGPPARELAPTIAGELLKERDLWEAADLMRALLAIDPPSARAILPLLQTSLRDRSERTRGLAATLAGELGPVAVACEPILRELRQDEWRNVREAADEALRRIRIDGLPSTSDSSRTAGAPPH